MTTILPLVEVLHPGMMALVTRMTIAAPIQRVDRKMGATGHKTLEVPDVGVNHLAGGDTHPLIRGGEQVI